MADDLYVAKESANFDYAGQPVFVTAGITTVRAGHPILRDHAGLFEPIRVHFDVPKPEPEPESKPEAKLDESAPVNPVRADQRGARSRTA